MTSERSLLSYSYLVIMNILLVGNRHHQLFIVYYFNYIIDDKSIPICLTFMRN